MKSRSSYRNWKCQLKQVDLHNVHKMVVCVTLDGNHYVAGRY